MDSDQAPPRQDRQQYWPFSPTPRWMPYCRGDTKAPASPSLASKCSNYTYNTQQLQQYTHHTLVKCMGMPNKTLLGLHGRISLLRPPTTYSIHLSATYVLNVILTVQLCTSARGCRAYSTASRHHAKFTLLINTRKWPLPTFSKNAPTPPTLKGTN